MLATLADPGAAIDYVVVHKIDRLARDRADDVAIMLAIRQAGAVLVSVAEQIDETPSGRLMHGIMASFAEYYSANLASEAKKGMAQKAKNGGTHGVAPLGYLNTIERSNGREVKGITIDEERAEHVRWAFAAYATGEWSVSSLRDALEERGLRSRTTQKYPGQPLNDAQVHRMLGKVYYIGKIQYQGIILDGAHDALIDEQTWFKVQDILAGRRMAGDRSWRHTHYLKGSLTCGRCGGRMGYGRSRGKGGTYSYFFCLGRHTGRTNCNLPYVNIEKVEKAVADRWRRISFGDQAIEQITREAKQQLEEHFRTGELLAKKQTDRLRGLERTKQKLIDAFVAEAIPVEDLKERQLAVAKEIADAKGLITEATQDKELILKRLDAVLALARRAGKLYEASPDEAKQWLNQAMFERFEIDLEDDNSAPAQAAYETTCHAESILSEAASAVLAPALDSAGGNKRTPASLTAVEGSNVSYLAEPVGFEPTVGSHPHNFSRVAPSAARTRFRGRV